MDEIIPRLTLNYFSGWGKVAITQFVSNHFSACSNTSGSLFDACVEFSSKNKRLETPSIEVFKQCLDKAEKIYQSCLTLDIIILVPSDSRYPIRLSTVNPPLLFAKGNIEALNAKYIAGLIGSRDPKPWAADAIRHLGKEYAESNIAVLSGLAKGCDTEAHLGCLDTGGTTIAVLGCGINNIFPKQNLPLAEKIISSGGYLISEYAPNEPVRSFQLIDRSKLQAELSDCIVVGQAKTRSGSMHAPLHALKKLHRLVAVLSGEQYLDDDFSGNTKLIQDYNATPLISQQDKLNFISSLTSV